MKKILLLALSIGAMFACSKQTDLKDEVTPDGSEKTVILKINQEAISKGVSDGMFSGEYSVIASARIYYLDEYNEKVGQRDLTVAEIASIANTNMDNGGKTISLSGIPSQTKKLYMVANVETSVHPLFPILEGNLGNTRLRIDRLQENRDNVTMSAISYPLVSTSGGNYTTSIVLVPIVSRLEIGKVTCKNEVTPGGGSVNADITEYKLSGVFINNVPQHITVDSRPYMQNDFGDVRLQSTWNTPTAWEALFAPTNSVFPFSSLGTPVAPTGWVNNSMVTHCTPDNSGLSFYPDVTKGSSNTPTVPAPPRAKVWGYQVAATYYYPMDLRIDFPHIILKLTDVKYKDNPFGKTTLYVTVQKYKFPNGDPIEEFRRGYVYRINDLVFNYNQATEKPYISNITCEATVTVTPWVVHNVEPDFE